MHTCIPEDTPLSVKQSSFPSQKALSDNKEMNPATAIKVRNYLNSVRENLTHLLESLVLAESPSSVKDAQKKVQELVSIELGKEGYSVKHFKGHATGGHLFARPQNRRSAKGIQLLLGHCDTVWPLDTLSRMPLSTDSGQIKGPGVYDMKAGLVQIIFALRCIRELKLDPELTPVVFINSDEEIGSRESSRHIRRLARISDRALCLGAASWTGGKAENTPQRSGPFYA